MVPLQGAVLWQALLSLSLWRLSGKVFLQGAVLWKTSLSLGLWRSLGAVLLKECSKLHVERCCVMNPSQTWCDFSRILQDAKKNKHFEWVSRLRKGDPLFCPFTRQPCYWLWGAGLGGEGGSAVLLDLHIKYGAHMIRFSELGLSLQRWPFHHMHQI